MQRIRKQRHCNPKQPKPQKYVKAIAYAVCSNARCRNAFPPSPLRGLRANPPAYPPVKPTPVAAYPLSRGMVRARHLEAQAEQAWCLTFGHQRRDHLTTGYYGLAVEQMRREGRRIDNEVLAHISPTHSLRTSTSSALSRSTSTPNSPSLAPPVSATTRTRHPLLSAMTRWFHAGAYPVVPSLRACRRVVRLLAASIAGRLGS